MKIKSFLNSYLSKKGNPVFVHSLEISAQELKDVEKSEAVYKKDGDEVLIFLDEKQAPHTPVRLTSNGKRLYAAKELANRRIQSQVNQLEAYLFLGINPVTGNKMNAEEAPQG